MAAVTTTPTPIPTPIGPTVRAAAQAQLRAAILDGHFVPEQKLTERELCLLTGASRSVLREALVHLEANGLIERHPYRGFRVAPLTPSIVEDIFELRNSLEGLAADLFSKRAGDDELGWLRAAFDELEAASRAGEPPAIRAAKEQFYDVLFTGCKNVEIRRALENVIGRIDYLRARWATDTTRRDASITELRALTDALGQRDREGARRASQAHLAAARDSAIARLAEAP